MGEQGTPLDGERRYGRETRAVRSGSAAGHPARPVVPPIWQSSTFEIPSVAAGAAVMRGQADGLVYTRLANPTISNLEEVLADLEGGAGAIVTGSGMAAIATVLLGLAGRGDRIVCARTVYGGTRSLIENELARLGVEAVFEDLADAGRAERTIAAGTRVVWIETPANPNLELTDIEAVSRLASSRGALTVVDNTFATPLLQRPLEHGADLVVHSLTKAINGHSDVVAGAIVGRDDVVLERLRGSRSRLGGVADPHQAWLVLRGIRTLPLRLRAAQSNAVELVERLDGHPAVARVRFPGRGDARAAALLAKQMSGPGTMIALELHGGAPAATRFLERLRLFVLAGSLGGVESLAMHPASMSHAGLGPGDLAAAGIEPGLVRLSVGCETCADLEADLMQALEGQP